MQTGQPRNRGERGGVGERASSKDSKPTWLPYNMGSLPTLGHQNRTLTRTPTPTPTPTEVRSVVKCSAPASLSSTKGLRCPQAPKALGWLHWSMCVMISFYDSSNHQGWWIFTWKCIIDSLMGTFFHMQCFFKVHSWHKLMVRLLQALSWLHCTKRSFEWTGFSSPQQILIKPRADVALWVDLWLLHKMAIQLAYHRSRWMECGKSTVQGAWPRLLETRQS